MGLDFIIGEDDWRDALRAAGHQLDAEYWAGFSPVDPSAITACETAIGRIFPEDFRAFLTAFGCGDFPGRFGGGIYSPAEIKEGCPGPLWMLLGSYEWASPEGHRAYYASRGETNPDPARFTPGVTHYEGVELLELVQIGYDGRSCYYQITEAQVSAEFGFCRITPEGTFEDKSASFTTGLKAILADHAQQHAERLA